MPDEAAYLLNHERSVGTNAGDLGHSNPMPANYPAAQIQQPGGECYDAGGFEDKITNEDYSFVFNSNGAHYLQRISGKNGVEVVYSGDCLQLSADPQHKITPERAILRLDEVYNKDNQSCKNRHGKQVIWTDGLNPIGCIDTEASIATNGFTTPFFDICPDPCAMIQLCVPEICIPITGEFVPRTQNDIGLTNRLLENTFKFMVRHIYYDLRANEWSSVSKPFYLNDKDCFQSPDSLPRCISLTIPAGNPMVERIEIAYSNGTIADDGVNERWFLHTTIEKYKKYNNTQQKWYERDLAENVTDTFNPDDCTFLYNFCNDKECTIIDPKETSRVYNPLPGQPQGILRVKENNFGFYNYIQGNCPFDKTEVEKFKVSLDCTGNICKEEYATVTVRALIMGVSQLRDQCVYRMGGTFNGIPNDLKSYGGEDDITDRAYFGGTPSIIPVVATDKIHNGICSQYFGGKQRNFTAYIEGTRQFSEMKQWIAAEGFINRQEVGILTGMVSNNNAVDGGTSYFFQETKFRVLKGARGFIRLQSHLASTNDPSTSTHVQGLISLPAFRKISDGSNYAEILNTSLKEIPFDTCGGDQDINDAFLIACTNGYATESGTTVDKSNSLYSGYVSDANNLPVANAILANIDDVTFHATDFNGFYYKYIDTTTFALKVKVEQDCAAFKTVENRSFSAPENSETKNDIIISDQQYADKFFTTFKVGVLDCNGNLIPGLTIAALGQKSKITDAASGKAIFKVRNNYTRNINIKAVLMDVNGCFRNACDGSCNPCSPTTQSIQFPACFANTTPGFPVIDVNTIEKINIEGAIAGKRYLKNGGRYPLGIVVQGDCGKLSAVYELPYLDVPKIQATNKESGCILRYDATGIKLPDYATCVKVVRGENINAYQIQWFVDKIEKTADGKIKLTIQSLNDYNEQYFFKTNTIYQWLKGDRVEFIRDQDGNIIPASDHGILNYLTLSPFHDKLISGRADADANYFNQLLIEDDGRIDFLKAGSVIEIQRANECTTEPIFYEIASIPVVNGSLLYPIATIETFDTYLKKRIINGSALQIFEHHSPSDFWGTGLTDSGKAYFKNIYENERRYGRNISINAVGQFNYFGDLVKTMPATQQGDIIAMSIADGKVILAICENDNFIAMSADDLLRLNNNNTVSAMPPDAIIGNPEAKISGMYGCRYSDIGSVYFGDGFATWYDGNKYAYVKHDFKNAKDVSIGKTQSYFRTVGAKMDLINKTAADLDKVRFATGFNYLTSAVIITNKSLRHSGVNNDKKLYESPNSTLLFHPESEDFLTMASYTAERYSHVTLDDGFGCAFLAYFNGTPYIHPVVPEKWNEFFGVAVDRVMTLAINKYPQKEKMPLAFELQSKMRYFVSNVETSDPNFKSEIPPVKVEQFGKKWNGSFLRNINSVGGLFKGKEASDYWMKVTFVRDNTQELNGKPVYGSIDNEKRIRFDSLSLIFFRFQLSEESGFPE